MLSKQLFLIQPGGSSEQGITESLPQRRGGADSGSFLFYPREVLRDDAALRVTLEQQNIRWKPLKKNGSNNLFITNTIEDIYIHITYDSLEKGDLMVMLVQNYL